METASQNTANLDEITQEDDNKYRPTKPLIGEQSISPQQQGTNKIIGALNDPFNQMGRNWDTLKNDYSNGHIMSGLFDTYAMAKSPTGNWGGQPSQSTPQSQAAAQFNPAIHSDGVDNNGNHIPNAVYKQQLLNQAKPMEIADNSGLASQFQGKGNVPGMTSAPRTKGLIGRFVDQHLQTGADNMISNSLAS